MTDPSPVPDPTAPLFPPPTFGSPRPLGPPVLLFDPPEPPELPEPVFGPPTPPPPVCEPPGPVFGPPTPPPPVCEPPAPLFPPPTLGSPRPLGPPAPLFPPPDPVIGPPTPPVPPGPVFGPPTPPAPPELHIRGGAGGTRAQLDALMAAAARAHRAADHLDEVARRARLALVGVDQTAGASPGTVGPVHAAAAPLLSPGGGLRARAEQARHAAEGLRATAALYQQADVDATAALRSAAIVVGHHLGEAGPLAVFVSANLVGAGVLLGGGALLQARLLRWTPTPAGLALQLLGSSWMRERPGPLGWLGRAVGGPGLLPADLGTPHASTLEPLVPGLAAMLRALLPGRQSLPTEPIPALAADLRRLAGLATLLFGLPRPGLMVAPLVTTPDPGGASEPRVPAGAGDLFEEITRVGSSGVPGTFSVTELEQADGSRTFVVSIPGQESLDLLDAPGPRDNASNLELMAGMPNDQTEAVLDVLTRAGLGDGDQVVLAGYSQGGMAAMAVANRIDHLCPPVVVTAGSPVARLPTPQGGTVLHLEHLLDPVTALDGAPNPDEVARTTVTHAPAPTPGSPSSLLHRVGGDLGRAHALSTYEETARLLDASGHRSAEAARQAIRDAVGTPVTITRTDYVATRVPAAGG